MDETTKTVGGRDTSQYDPLRSLKRESIDRMKAVLLSASLDDPLSAVSAMKHVTIMRAYHQVVRIVQYLDLMDKLEEKLYESIEIELATTSSLDGGTEIYKLLTIQEKLQKSVIESNKLLAPYLDMEQYPAFESIESATPVSAQVLEVSQSERKSLRENAGAILCELKELDGEVSAVPSN